MEEGKKTNDNPLLDGLFRGFSRMEEAKKSAPSLKSVTYIPKL